MENMSFIVLEQADRLFQQQIDKKVLSEADAGHWPDTLWGALEDAGLPLALVPETKGGVELASGVVASLIRRSAFHSVPLPLAETMMANALWTDAGGKVIEGAVTLAPVNHQDRITLASGATGVTLHGIARHVPWGKQASNALVFARDAGGKAYLCRVPTAKVRSSKKRRNVAYEPREDIEFDGVHLTASDVLPSPAYLTAEGLMPFGAAIRVQQMIGGMERCMDYALAYANERVQFGRPISKFQAIQHMLAIAAGHFAAASAAGDTLVEAERLGDDVLAVAIAKSRCGEAAGQVAAICHQVHGAMGFTQEHPLHYASRRLWSWRDEWGAEPWWQERIGRMVCAEGGERFWPLLVDRPRVAGAA
ncbi:acyl-CoA dehydrogenase [Bradyrhizobium sp. ISRA443]|uniref:acyl-CoA dehydrogenase n=1 Tax=unclassified Bradyrhizobium TaxID=2631580 RepID=UPI00247B106F|nr:MULTISPECIES: acyl-CoA dehydrogenase [unclassified Bradyrhizobium]WGR93066.1 acyl-CoA dehydrogenase [Bradyrhizobium sp. ISRA435]WGR97567.1 acyl-CoA dehydrogenase [Bradyrhizobium sp. ISRA436]WGS04457.1 acyl-CoA dehydrogenase [Bradyrhizobium sp. ISRA437]WGS11338.1 acyl-CoA dehydrogenase [Bradyrhizobium sp. ISRA443]